MLISNAIIFQCYNFQIYQSKILIGILYQHDYIINQKKYNFNNMLCTAKLTQNLSTNIHKKYIYQ